MTAIYSYNPYQSQSYFNKLSQTEYFAHSQFPDHYSPNKDVSFLSRNKVSSKNKQFIFAISDILQLILIEFVILHLYDTSFVSNDDYNYCTDYLHKYDHDGFEYLLDRQQKTKDVARCRLAAITTVHIRSLFRKNSAKLKFNHQIEAKYIYGLIGTIKRWNKTKINEEKGKIHLLRAALNFIWIPLLFCVGANNKAFIDEISIQEEETLLCWYGRLFCRHKTTKKSISKLKTTTKLVEKYESERAELVCPYLKPAKCNAYKAEFMQHVLRIRHANNITKSKFRDTATAITNVLSPAVHKMGGVPKWPSNDTITRWEAIEIEHFISCAKNLVFANGAPSTVCADAVKRTGIGGKKVVPLRITTNLEDLQFALTYVCQLNDKHGDKGIDVSNKLIEKCTEFGVKCVTFYCADTASSEIKSWYLMTQSKLPHIKLCIFVPDLPHAINSAFSLSIKMLCGDVRSGLFRQSTISFVLSWTIKLTQGNAEYFEWILLHYAADTYNTIITAACTRFLGFVDAIFSLLFFSNSCKCKRKKIVCTCTQKPDYAKLVLLASILKKIQNDKKKKKDKTQEEVIQYLIWFYGNRLCHAMLYITYCIGLNCFVKTMKFCTSFSTRVVGIFNHISSDLKILRSTKHNLLSKIQQNYGIDLIKSALVSREHCFDFSAVYSLKKCILKRPNADKIRPNSNLDRCNCNRSPNDPYVCSKHRQCFESEKLELLTKYLPASLHKLNALENISVLLKDVIAFDEYNENEHKYDPNAYTQFFKPWIDYTQSYAYQDLMNDIDELSADFISCFFDVQSLIAIDWAHYKFSERVLAFFELGFFIPFAIIDIDIGHVLANNIIQIGRNDIKKQFADYIKIPIDEFKKLLAIEIGEGYDGPFGVCEDDVWNELCVFAEQSEQKSLIHCSSEFPKLSSWCFGIVNCFSWTLLVERANKIAKHIQAQCSVSEQSMNEELFNRLNGKDSLHHNAITIAKYCIDEISELGSLKTSFADSEFSDVFPMITDQMAPHLRKEAKAKKKIVHKQKSAIYCKGDDVNLSELKEDLETANDFIPTHNNKRKSVMKGGPSKKRRKENNAHIDAMDAVQIQIADEIETDYSDEENYDDLELQELGQRESHHLDPLEQQRIEKRVQNIEDISSMTENTDYFEQEQRRRNHNKGSNFMMREDGSDYDWDAEAYRKNASKRKRKAISDKKEDG